MKTYKKGKVNKEKFQEGTIYSFGQAYFNYGGSKNGIEKRFHSQEIAPILLRDLSEYMEKHKGAEAYNLTIKVIKEEQKYFDSEIVPMLKKKSYSILNVVKSYDSIEERIFLSKPRKKAVKISGTANKRIDYPLTSIPLQLPVLDKTEESLTSITAT